MKRRKILKKVCEMSKYLTLIPLLRQMCFPYSHSCWGEKMTWWFWEISLSFFFFFFSRKCDLGLNRAEILLNSICQPPSSFLSYILFFFSMFPFPVKKADIVYQTHPPSFWVCSYFLFSAGAETTATPFASVIFFFFYPPPFLNFLLPVSSCSF